MTGTVDRMFALQAARTPERVAVVHGDRSLTYAQLARAVDAWAAELRRHGVGPEVLVGLMLDRSLELVVGCLAVLRAGGGYLPLEPGSPPDRLALMLADAAPRAVLTSAGLRTQAAGDAAGPAVLTLDLANLPAPAPLEPAAHPENLAYVLYTSGSTGRPKGVQVTHASVANYLAWAAREYLPDPDGAVPLHSSVGFDFAVTSLLLPLVTGARIVVLDDYHSLMPDRGEGFRLVKLTPAHLAADRAGAGPRPPARADARPAPVLVVGGEALTAEALAGWRADAGPVEVINEYGPTEATVGCTSFRCRVDALAPGPVPIGRAISGAAIHLLDEALRPVPPGRPGEVFVGGLGVARGYLQRPGLTAQRFVPDPYSEAPGARMYRTGDRARLRADGELEYLGRVDEQVKIMGYRIEPGEIEAALVRHPDVAGAAVTVGTDSAGDRRLIAHLVAAPGRPAPHPGALLPHLQRLLPTYMVPLSFVVVDALPLTANGKLDRQALTRPGSPEVRETSRVGPAAIAALWADVLGLPAVGPDDNFLEIGGHSLAATRVNARLMAEYGRTLPLRAYFEHPTPRQLSNALTGAVDPPRLPPVAPAGGAGPWPLSAAQQRLWFLDQLTPGSAEYHVPLAWRLRGPLREDALRAALDGLVGRHRALRTALPAVDGVPRQVLGPARCVLETTGVPPGPESGGVLRRLVDAEVERPFDLARGPLVRARLFRVGPTDQVLVLTLHHVVTDVRSTGLLRDDLPRLYAASAAPDVERAAPAGGVEYTDFAVWQRQMLTEPALAEQLDYWRVQLKELPDLDVAGPAPRPPRRTNAGVATTFRLDPLLCAQVRQLALGMGASPAHVMLAAYAAVLARRTGTLDLPIGSPVSSRPAVGVDKVVGCFLNMVTLRLDASGEPTFAELTRRAGRTTTEALEHADIPFESVVDELARRRPDRTPLFQVVFSHQIEPAAAAAPGFPGLEADPFPVGRRTAKFELTLAVVEAADGIRVTWEYRTDLLDAPTVDGLHAEFESVLRDSAADPDQALALLPAGSVVRGPRPSVPAFRVDELVAAQAARTPDAVAVVAGQRRLTYAELATRSAGLARRPLAAGAGREHPVAVYLRRDADLLVALLGVWRAGAAYVPLDPAQPASRLAAMVTAAGSRLVVTRADLDARPVAGAARVVAVEDEVDTGDPAHDEPRGRPADLAYVIFTSGSTGAPKGVEVEHRSVVNLLAWFAGELAITAADVLVSVTTPAFDIAVLELFLPLIRGGRVVLAGAAETGDPDALRDLVAGSGATVVQATPTGWRVLLEAGKVPERVRARLCGGEAMPPDLAERLHSPRARLWNVYGPTETTIWSSAAVVDPGRDAVGIGVPIGNTDLSVRDERLRTVPAGRAGEICIGGAGVARGYLRAPALTARRFVPDPLGAPGARMYRTGDLGRVRPDGGLDYLGRMDQQVKIRGHRVEPAEVEAALRRHPQVRAAAVTSDQDASGAARLVGYLVPRAGEQSPEAAELRTFLLEHLPAYMVPAVFVALAELPLTSNGKVDRLRLPAPGAAAALSGEWVAPRTSAEAALAGVWADVLGIDDIGATDDFFALGGDSILGLQVVARARNAGLWITPIQLFDFPTIAELAAAAHRVGEVALPADGPFSGELAAPAGAGRTGTATVEVGLPAGVGVDGRTGALAELVARHDLLRARRIVRAGEPVLEIGEHATVELRPAGVAGRFQLRLDAALVDRVSLRILAEDLHDFAAARRGEGEGRSPSGSVGYPRWDERVRQYANSAVAESELDYWRSLEPGPPAVGADLEPVGPGTAGAVAEPAELDLDLDLPGLGAALAWYGCVPAEFVLAALVRTLGETPGATIRVTLDDQRRRRHFPELPVERTMGPLARRYPVQLRRESGDPLLGVRAVQAQLRRIPREGLPFAAVHDFGGRPRHWAAPAGFGDLAVLVEDDWADPGTRLATWPQGLALEVASIARDRLRVRWTWRTDRYLPSTVERLRTGFAAALSELVAAATGGARPADVPSARLTQAQLDRVCSPGDVEDAYPLTPAQHGMLFHSLYRPGEGMYLNQASFLVRGAFDPDRFAAAVAVVAEAHPALRSAFVGRGLAEPHQVVRTGVAPPIRVLPARAAADPAALLADQRREDLAFDRAPLYRVTIAPGPPGEHQVLWTSHHMMADGWSSNLVFGQVWDAYAALAAGRPPRRPPARPYREFVRWVTEQDQGPASAFWRSHLAGATPTLVTRDSGSGGEPVERVLDRRLSATDVARARARQAATRTTLATLVCAGWAKTLGELTGERDVVHGVVLSGRSAPLPGLDQMVGLLANTLPLRVRLPGPDDPAELLRTVGVNLAQLRRHENSVLSKAQEQAGLSPGQALFDTAVGVQNFPYFRGLPPQGGLDVRRGPAFSRNNYAVTVSVFPGTETVLRLRTDPARLAGPAAELLADRLLANVRWLLAE